MKTGSPFTNGSFPALGALRHLIHADLFGTHAPVWVTLGTWYSPIALVHPCKMVLPWIVVHSRSLVLNAGLIQLFAAWSSSLLWFTQQEWSSLISLIH